MSGDLYVGAFWGPRKEQIDQCADRLTECMARIGVVDAVYQAWYETGVSAKDALKRIAYPASRAKIIRLLERGRHFTDVPRRVMEDLGFDVSIWNGAGDEKAVSMSVGCGLYSEAPNLRNRFILDLPQDLGNLASKDKCRELLDAVARSWRPEWAGIISRYSRDARDCATDRPIVDWIFYTNRVNINRSELPRSASVQAVGDLGIIIVVQDRPIDPTNSQDLANIAAVEAAVGLTQ